jgi:hypothetical protein
MITYSQLTRTQKIDLINHLRHQRMVLLDESKKRRASRSSNKRTKKPMLNMKFASPELEKIFKNMPASQIKEFMKDVSNKKGAIG